MRTDREKGGNESTYTYSTLEPIPCMAFVIYFFLGPYVHLACDVASTSDSAYDAASTSTIFPFYHEL